MTVKFYIYLQITKQIKEMLFNHPHLKFKANFTCADSNPLPARVRITLFLAYIPVI